MFGQIFVEKDWEKKFYWTNVQNIPCMFLYHSHDLSDIDECEQQMCGANTECVNTEGSYSCECKDGFEMENSGDCVNINECSDGKDNCDADTSTCKDTVGGFDCVCKTGYTKKASGLCEGMYTFLLMPCHSHLFRE